MKMLAAVLAIVAVVGCKGAEGPMGPAGPAGPSGPGTKLLLTAPVLSDGRASVALPAAAGSDRTKPPGLTCYVGDPSAGSWVAIASTPSSTYPYCGLAFSADHFVANVFYAPAGLTAAFVVVY